MPAPIFFSTDFQLLVKHARHRRAAMPARSRQRRKIPSWIGGCRKSLNGIVTMLTGTGVKFLPSLAP